MGTSVVKFTDRKYMMQLQEKILQSHYESTEKRMNNRMNEEVEREKRLILENKMPFSDAGGLSAHPVFVVRGRLASDPRIVALNASAKKRYARIQDMESAIKTQEEVEKRMDAGSRVTKKKVSLKSADEKEGVQPGSSELSVETAGSDKASMRVLLDSAEFEEEGRESEGGAAGRRLQAEDGGSPEGDKGRKMPPGSPSLQDDYADEMDWEEESDLGEGYTEAHYSLSEHLGYSPSIDSVGDTTQGSCTSISPGKEFDRVKYEAPLVKELRRVETVDQLYELAEQIIGPVPPCGANK